MDIKIYEKGLVTFYINVESGNLYVRNTHGGHEAVNYSANIGNNEPMDLKSYMYITGKNLKDSVDDLCQEGIALVGHRFNINFFNEEGVYNFIKKMGAERKESGKTKGKMGNK